MLAAIEFVSFRQFSSSMDAQLKHFIDEEKNLNSVVIVIPSYKDVQAIRSGTTETIKSGHWLAGRALEKFPVLQNLDVVSTHESARMKSIFANRQRIRVLLIDDMAVTGGQIQDNVAEILRSMPKALRGSSEFNLLVPYRTFFSEWRVEGVIPIWHPGAEIRWLCKAHEVRDFKNYMFGSRDNEAEADSNYREALRASNIIFEHDVEGGRLTIYEHKLPDSKSFPKWLAEGRIPDGKGGEKAPVPFIEAAPATYLSWSDEDP